MGARGNNQKSFAFYEEIPYLRVTDESSNVSIYKRRHAQKHLPIEQRSYIVHIPVPNTKTGIRKSLKVIDRDFIAAQEYADRAKEIDPRHNDVITLQSNIDFQKMRVEEERIFGILQEGREMVLNDDCAGALPYYEDYLSQAEPNALIYKEYGDVLFCAQEYEQALRAYDDALADGYYFDAALQTLGEMRMQSSAITNQGGV